MNVLHTSYAHFIYTYCVLAHKYIVFGGALHFAGSWHRSVRRHHYPCRHTNQAAMCLRWWRYLVLVVAVKTQPAPKANWPLPLGGRKPRQLPDRFCQETAFVRVLFQWKCAEMNWPQKEHVNPVGASMVGMEICALFYSAHSAICSLHIVRYSGRCWYGNWKIVAGIDILQQGDHADVVATIELPMQTHRKAQ